MMRLSARTAQTLSSSRPLAGTAEAEEVYIRTNASAAWRERWHRGMNGAGCTPAYLRAQTDAVMIDDAPYRYVGGKQH